MAVITHPLGSMQLRLAAGQDDEGNPIYRSVRINVKPMV